MRSFLFLFIFLPSVCFGWGAGLVGGSTAAGGGGTTPSLLDTPYSEDGTYQSYPVSAGTNRLLVVCVGAESSSYTTGVDFGDTAMTLQLQEVNDITRVEIYTLDESGISGATGDGVSIGGSNNVTFHILSLENVDQTTPITETSTNTGTVSVLTTSITAANNSAVIACANHNGTDTTTWSSDLTEQTDQYETPGGHQDSTAFGAFDTGQSVTAESNYSTSQRSAIIAVEIAGD